jgi:replication factor A1
MAEDLQRDIQDILDALSDETETQISREDLEKELRKFIEYGVPLDHAKQTLVKKFGGSLVPVGSTERTLLVDLQPDEPRVNLLCRVLTITPKEITVRGDNRKIFYGILGDESGTIPFTAWKDFEIEKGDVLRITNAYTREWQGDTKVNFGDRTKIEKTEESNLPDISSDPKEFKVKDLRSGIGAVEITVRILDITKRDVDVEGKKKTVYSGIIGDETGKAQFTSWHDFSLKKDDIVTISGGYVKSWKGIPQLTIDDQAKVKQENEKKIAKADIKTTRIPLYELVERFGALDVEVEGTVVRIRDGSGVVHRCPECKRVLQGGECQIHGKVSGIVDVRIKLDIDDGMGTLAGLLGRESTEKLLGKSFDELKKLTGSDDNKTLVDEMNTKLFGHRLRLQGNALGDEFGVTLIAKTADFVDFNIEQEAERITQELEDLG